MTDVDLAGFCAALIAAVGPDEPMTLRQIVDEARKGTPAADRLAAEIQALQPGREKVSRVALGRTLKAAADNPPAVGLALQAKPDTHSKQLKYCVLPVGAPFPAKRTKTKRLQAEARREIKQRVEEGIERIRSKEKWHESRATMAKARELVAANAAGPSTERQPETAWVSRAEQERTSAHSPGTYNGTYRELSRAPAEPAPRASTPTATGKRTAPRQRVVRSGVSAVSVETGTAESAHRYCRNIALGGFISEVRRRADGSLELFAACTEADSGKVCVFFARRGFRTLYGDDSQSEHVPAPPPVVVHCRPPQGGGAFRWDVFKS